MTFAKDTFVNQAKCSQVAQDSKLAQERECVKLSSCRILLWAVRAGPCDIIGNYWQLLITPQGFYRALHLGLELV